MTIEGRDKAADMLCFIERQALTEEELDGNTFDVAWLR